MTEQPGYVLEEAVKLLDTLRRRWNSTVGGPGGAGATGGEDPGDVWGQAVREEPEHLPGAAAECRYCPICRTIAAAREGGPDVVSHMMDAGQSLIAAVREAAAAYERARPPDPPGGARPAGTRGWDTAEASGGAATPPAPANPMSSAAAEGAASPVDAGGRSDHHGEADDRRDGGGAGHNSSAGWAGPG